MCRSSQIANGRKQNRNHDSTRCSDRKLVLVDLTLQHNGDPLESLGTAGLLAALLEVMPGSAAMIPVVVNSPGINATQISRRILRKVAGGDQGVTVGFGAYVWNSALVRETITALRRDGFRGQIVVGGPQVTYGDTPEADFPGADVFIRGYAEQALPEIVRGSKRGLRGVQYSGDPMVSGPCDFELASCPSPYLTGILPISFGQEVVRWETQRGCPYRCAYCQHGDPDMQPHVQKVPFGRLTTELDLFVRRGVREIKVIDPVFNRGKHAIRVLDALRTSGYEGRISVQCRPELLSASFAEACTGLTVVPELGLQTIHREESRLIDRTINLDRVSRAFELLNARGQHYAVTIIFGLPGQTVTSFQQTVDFCLRHHVPEIKAFPLMLLKGCGLDRRRKELGLVVGGGSLPIVQSSPTFDEHDFQMMAALGKALDLTAGFHPGSVAYLFDWNDGASAIRKVG